MLSDEQSSPTENGGSPSATTPSAAPSAPAPADNAPTEAVAEQAVVQEEAEAVFEVASRMTDALPEAVEAPAAKPGRKAKAAKAPKPAKVKLAKQPKAKPAKEPKAGGDLAAKLRQRLAADKLPLPVAAKLIGVNTKALSLVVAGRKTPNARTAGKYAAFLAKALPVIKAPKQAKVRGRKPRQADPAATGSLAQALATLRSALSQGSGADSALAADRLAVAVHGASDSARAVVAAVLKALA